MSMWNRTWKFEAIQIKMKQWYDKDAMIREFKPGEKVIVLLLIPCHKLQAKYFWPYVIESRLNDLNYIVNTHTRRNKRQICQVTTQGFSKDYKLTVDACDVGVSAVLLQEGNDDIDLPNCYFFLKSFTNIRKINPQLKKKWLALLVSFEALWWTYHPFEVFTDHNTVTFIKKMQNKNHRLTGWGLMLQEYNLNIKHIKCKDTFIANVLYRVGQYFDELK